MAAHQEKGLLRPHIYNVYTILLLNKKERASFDNEVHAKAYSN